MNQQIKVSGFRLSDITNGQLQELIDNKLATDKTDAVIKAVQLLYVSETQEIQRTAMNQQGKITGFLLPDITNKQLQELVDKKLVTNKAAAVAKAIERLHGQLPIPEGNEHVKTSSA
jgi:hypothetical protein